MQQRLSSESGIAIGVILFALAIIAVISVAMGAGSNFSGSIIATDRIREELKSQAQLITTKIRECYNNGLANKQTDCENNTYVTPSGGGQPYWTRTGCNPIDTTAFYPTSAATGTVIAAVTCPGYAAASNNLWTGQVPLLLPSPPNGMDNWYYINAGDTGGRCIRIVPLPANISNAAIKQGLIESANSFSAQELTFDANSASQRFIIWITRPTGTASAECSS